MGVYEALKAFKRLNSTDRQTDTQTQPNALPRRICIW